VPLGSDLRLLRATVFAGVCLLLSAVGHAMMSGQGIPAWALAVGFAGVLAVAAGLTGRERSYPGIAGAVLASELGLHFFFSTAQSATQGPAQAAPVALWASALLCVPDGSGGAALPPGMSVRALLRQVGLDPALTMHPPTGSASPSTAMGTGGMAHGVWAMVAAHVAAGLLSAWWLRRGEAAAFALLRTMGALAVGCLLRLVLLALGFVRGRWTPPAPARRLDGGGLLPRTGRRALLHAVVRRGPPPRPAVA
jgi:hypothetical protein